MLNVVNNGAEFAAGQIIDTYYPLSGTLAKCQWFYFKSLGGTNYTIHLRDNVNLVLAKASNGHLKLAEYDSGNANQIFSVENITGYSSTGYYDYDTLENYYRGLNWRWPLDNNVKTLSSSYGYRYLNGDQFHQGIDVPATSALYSVNSGIVVDKGFRANSYGYYVVLELNNRVYDPNNTETATKLRVVYQHMSGSYNYPVGTSVSRGTNIGTAGNTGDSSGSHLHLTVISNGGSIASGTTIASTLNPLMFYGPVGMSFINY